MPTTFMKIPVLNSAGTVNAEVPDGTLLGEASTINVSTLIGSLADVNVTVLLNHNRNLNPNLLSDPSHCLSLSSCSPTTLQKFWALDPIGKLAFLSYIGEKVLAGFKEPAGGPN